MSAPKGSTGEARPVSTDEKTPRRSRFGLKRKPRGGSGRGALMIIACLLAGSGALRLGQGAERYFMMSATNQVEATGPEVCAPAGEETKLLEALRAREAAVSGREQDIDVRAQTISIAEAAIDAKMKELAEAEAELAKTMAIADRAADEDVARLVSLYENMKPKQAAPLFEEMAPEFAAGFLSRMRPDAGAAILAGLDPKSAYSISVLMAGRNANAPKN